MKSRCFNPNNGAYSRYGGLGITVCEAWVSSYETFLNDMGRKPSPAHSLDRKNNNGNYEPTNCRWATPTEQARNRRSNRLILFEGRRLPITQVAEIVYQGENREKVADRITARLKRGWSEVDAIYGRSSHIPDVAIAGQPIATTIT